MKAFPLLTVLLWGVTLALTADEPGGFRLAGRDFPPDEISALRRMMPTGADWQKFVFSQKTMLCGIVLCERSGVKLSPAETRESLRRELLLLPPEQKQQFSAMLKARSLRPDQWVEEQSRRLDRQFAEAIRRWYRKVYAGDSHISRSQISDWYFRNQPLFLTYKLDMSSIRTFAANEMAACRQALALWQQGGAAASTLPADEEAVALALRQVKISQYTVPAAGFRLYQTSTMLILMRDGAVKRAYRALDEELQLAIGDLLYDALAKARLAEHIRRDLGEAEISFY